MLIGIDARPANQWKRDGVGNYCSELLRAMIPMAGPDVRFRIYLDEPPIEGFPVSPGAADIRLLPPCRLWTQRALARELRRNPPSVFLAPSPQFPILCSCPRVVAVLDLAFYDFAEHFTWRFRAVSRLYTRLVVLLARHLLCISESTKADLLRRFRLKEESITVALLAPSCRFQPCTDTEMLEHARERYGLPEHYILYVGRLQPRKNIGRLVEAFELLGAKHPELRHRLVIAGEKGWMHSPIYEAASRSAAADRIQFLGYVAREDLPAVISAADVLTLVSLWEGFGLPVLEAMACGTAVVTSNCSSLPEVAGDAAILVDPYDPSAIETGIERVLFDDALRADLEARGRARAACFTWESTARKTLAVLQACAGNARL